MSRLGRAMRTRYKRDLIAFVKGYSWEWFFLGTYNRRVTERTAQETFKQYFDALAIAGADRLFAFYCWERGSVGQRIHVHAVFAWVGDAQTDCGSNRPGGTPCCAKHLWNHGIAEVKRFNPNLGGIEYMTKALTADSYDFLGTPPVASATCKICGGLLPPNRLVYCDDECYKESKRLTSRAAKEHIHVFQCVQCGHFYQPGRRRVDFNS